MTAGAQTQSFPPQGTEVIDSASAEGAGTWTQVWHSYVNTDEPPSDSTFSITPSGVFIISEVIRMTAAGQTVTFSCSFSAPVEVLDWPPAVGHQFSGTGNCTSPNNSYGSFAVRVSGSLTGTQSTTIGGSSTTVFVVSTKVTTSGSVDSTSTETDWFDPSTLLDVYESDQESGSYEGFSFSSHIVRSLVSKTPT